MSVFSVMRMERDIIISMRVAMCRFFVRGMTVSVAPAVAMIMLLKISKTSQNSQDLAEYKTLSHREGMQH